MQVDKRKYYAYHLQKYLWLSIIASKVVLSKMSENSQGNSSCGISVQ